MRCYLLFGAVLAAGALSACGGSSSETPPPLQPDPAGFRYASASPERIVEESDAGDAPKTQTVPGTTELEPRPRVPAPSTGGSAPAAH
ncbi:MAG: hypothetical protein WDO69_34235 [Pseudomonadota bacterium]